ncbi:QueT transporter family protein [Vagococcus proximus]|nr:QueT transporter family protein [Vagococcus proximus]
MINKQETVASKTLEQESILTPKSMSKMAMVMALYVVVTVMISPLSYGFLQIRFAEMFNYLAVYNRRYIGAVSLGVAIANLNSPLGLIDVVVGSLSTYVVLTIIYYVTRKMTSERKKLLCVPIICSLSMFTIAAQLFILGDAPFWVSYLTIGIGEFVSLAIGLGVIWLMSNMTDMKKIKKLIQE